MMREMRGMAPWIMLIVAVSFVGWMVFDVGMNVSGQGSAGIDDIIRVNGHKIELQSYLDAVRNTQEQQRIQGAMPRISRIICLYLAAVDGSTLIAES